MLKCKKIIKKMREKNFIIALPFLKTENYEVLDTFNIFLSAK